MPSSRPCWLHLYICSRSNRHALREHCKFSAPTMSVGARWQGSTFRTLLKFLPCSVCLPAALPKPDTFLHPDTGHAQVTLWAPTEPSPGHTATPPSTTLTSTCPRCTPPRTESTRRTTSTEQRTRIADPRFKPSPTPPRLRRRATCNGRRLTTSWQGEGRVGVTHGLKLPLSLSGSVCAGKA